jgi:hypothetical protein
VILSVPVRRRRWRYRVGWKTARLVRAWLGGVPCRALAVRAIEGVSAARARDVVESIIRANTRRRTGDDA